MLISIIAFVPETYHPVYVSPCIRGTDELTGYTDS